MPPASVDTSEAAVAIEPFCAEASSVVVSFAPWNRESDHDPDCHCHPSSNIEPRNSRQTIRLSFRTSYTPRVVTFRFHAKVFSYHDGKKMATTIYVDIPPHHVLSIEHTTHLDPSTAPELSADDMQHFTSGVARVHFRLRQPGSLIEPLQELSLKPSSQRAFASLAGLASSRDLILFCPHTTLSKRQCQTLHRAITAINWTHERRQQQITEHRNWLGTLYSGNGGRLHDVLYDVATPTYSPAPDGGAAVITDSESGESTVATATPPAYSRRAASHDHDVESGHVGASGDEVAVPFKPSVTTIFKSGKEASPSLPAFNISESDDWEPLLTNDPKGKQARKRSRSSDEAYTQHRRQRLGTLELPSNDQQPSEALTEPLYLNIQHNAGGFTQLPASLILSKLDQVLEQNTSLISEIAAMRDMQQKMHKKLKHLIDVNHQHVQRIEELEEEISELDKRQDELESEQAGLTERQEDVEEKCSDLEIQVADQVQEAIRERLLSALETM